MSKKYKTQHLYEADDQDDVISKTQQKQIVHDLHELAKIITDMPKKKVAQLELPDTFLDAIEESKRINSHIARKRHFQYMGKILFKLDHENLKAQIEQIDNLDGHYQIRDAVINLWIEHLAEHETPLFDHLYQHHDHEVLSSLRQTLRNHRKKPEHAGNRKKLFQALRDVDKHTELPNPMALL